MSNKYQKELIQIIQSDNINEEYEVEILKQYNQMLGEMDLKNQGFQNICIELGTPTEFVDAYLNGRDVSIELQQDRRDNYRPKKVGFPNREERMKNIQFLHLGKPVQIILGIILMVPIVVNLSTIPDPFLPEFEYFTFYEMFGIDNYPISVFIILGMPFLYELISAITGKYLFNLNWMRRIRFIYRAHFVIILLSTLIGTFFKAVLTGVFISDFMIFLLLFVLYESIVNIVEIGFTPMYPKYHTIGSLSYKGFIIIIAFLSILIPVLSFIIANNL